MTQINIKIIGNGTVKQKPARIGPTIQLQAIPNSGATFLGWKGVAQSFTGGHTVCNVNPRYSTNVVAVFSENTNSTEYQKVTPNTLNPLQLKHVPELISEKSAINYDPPRIWVDDPTVQVSKVFDDFGRFIINDDGTVLDQSTSLMWTYKVYPKKILFSEAMAITKEFAGYADWRIPSIADLQSIMPSGKKFFHFNQECKSYWTNDSCHVVVDIRGHWAQVFNQFTSLLRLVRDVPRHPIKINITGTGSGDVKNFIVIQKNNGTLGKVPRTNNQYPLGTKIEVVADPGSYSRFLKWSGDASGTDLGYLFTVDGPKSVVAEFELINHKLTLHTTGSGKGSITPSTTAAEYPHGSVVTLTATPAQGSKFRRWSGDFSKFSRSSGDFSSTSPKITIAFDDCKTVTAEFVRFFPLTVSTSGSGTVQRSTQGNEYEPGSRVELNAVPAHGHRFVQWRGDATGTDPHCTLTIDGPKSVVAEFEVLTYPLTLQITGSGEGSITPSTTAAEYPHGSVVTLTATPAQGSVFRRWGGDASGSSPEKRITFDSGKTVTAEFVRMYSLSVSTKGKNQGLVQRSPETDEYEVGSTVKLRAIPAEGHEFVQWHGAAVGAKPTCSITMNANKTLTAEFRPLPKFDLTVTHTGSGRGVVLPTNQPYWKGSVVNLVAKANDGCVFDGWGGDAAGLEANCTVTVNAHLAITAAFSRVEVPDTDITVVFDSTVLSHADNREVTVFQFTVTNRTDRQIHIDIPLAGYVNLQGEEVEQTAWVKGMISGEKGATLRARTFRKMGLVFERHHLGAVKLGEHLHITVLQSKPAQRLSFAFRCTNASSQTLELVQASVESLAVENENSNGNAKIGETDAQAELTARMQLLEKSLQEALSRLSAPAPAAPAAPTQTLPEVLAWLCTQNQVPLAVFRQKLLPLGLMPSALINDVNERAFDVVGEAALNEAADTVTVQRGVLLQVLAVW